MLATVYVYVLSVNSRVIVWMLIDCYKQIIYVQKLVLDVFVLDLKLIFNRSVQSWPQSHVTSKLRNVYYLMSKVWSERECSVRKLSSSVDYQIMLMSCLQKKTKKSAKYRGRIHDYVPSKWSK